MREELPRGTVTFLFTDVEGSTRLLHELGAGGYAQALAEHRRAIREACAREGGVEVDTQGDAFFFAFPTAPGGLAAAADLTKALDSGPIQVRVGLHTGTPLVTDEGYVGDDVHFAARVGAAGHGGQVVVATSTAMLVDQELTELGEHRLKDIAEAVPLYQLGEGSFPPLKTISNTNLPHPASSFLGREREVAEVLGRIEAGARLVTLTGPGGTGKTRLALEAASSLVPEYKAGVFWVGLASLRDHALVTETISQTLGAKEGLAEYVGERELLLLLDNLEQVIEAAPDLASLLESCPNLTLLVTSRELLRVRGEVEYGVPPLAETDAVSLFCERAQLEPSEEIAELCARLDSLPLAVELAAARARAFAPAQILERLSERLDLLKGGRDADPRQQTLRATVVWSYDLLTEQEQELFCALSVFAGGCTLGTAEKVGNTDVDTIQSLVEKSLLRFAEGRYWMLETIRELASERLTRHAYLDSEAVRRRHFEALLALAEHLGPALRSSHDPRLLDEFEAENENFRAALSWAEENGHVAEEMELIRQMWLFWEIRGSWREGQRWIEAVLARTEGMRSSARAGVLHGAGAFARHLGDLELAGRRLEESLSTYRDLGDSANAAWSLVGLGALHEARGDNVRARSSLENALTEAGELDPRLSAVVTGSLAALGLQDGRFEDVRLLAANALAEFRELRFGGGISWTLYMHACALAELGRGEEALADVREAVAQAHAGRDVETLVWSLVLLASLLPIRGRLEKAAAVAAAADVLREQHELVITGYDLDLWERTVSELRRKLGAKYEAARVEGEAMSLDEAVEYALASLD